MAHEQHHHQTGHHEYPHPHPEIFNIRVNGKEKHVHQHVVDYAFIVHLAFPDEPNPGELLCKILYTGPHHQRGTLAQGQEVKLEDGMVFDVFPTGRS